jgi:uncharacterized protein (TIGR03437 family)
MRVYAKGIKALYVQIVAYIEALPGIFTVDGSVAIAQHIDTGRPVSAADPAKPGEKVAIYATGLGPLKGQIDSGVPAPASPPNREPERACCDGRRDHRGSSV